MSATVTPPAPVPAPATPPPAGGPRPWLWTREQYYKLGELGFFDGKRVELIRGEIIEMSPINPPHANATGLVSDALALVFAIGYHIRVQQPFAVTGGKPGTDPQPDVSVIPGSRRDYPDHPTVAALTASGKSLQAKAGKVQESVFCATQCTPSELKHLKGELEDLRARLSDVA